MLLSNQLNNLGIVAIYNWDELSPFQNGTNCRLGRIVAFWNLRRIYSLGRIVAQPNDFYFFAVSITLFSHSIVLIIQLMITVLQNAR